MRAIAIRRFGGPDVFKSVFARLSVARQAGAAGRAVQDAQSARFSTVTKLSMTRFSPECSKSTIRRSSSTSRTWP